MATRRLKAFTVAAVTIAVANLMAAQERHDEPSLQTVLQRMAAYVDTYGEKASLIIAVEEYTQQATDRKTPPRQLLSEFAIVKGARGWVGYRDVVAVDGQPISNRRDRLLSILTDPSADAQLVTKLAEESARFNIGPISRNFNVPTATLLLFGSANLDRFAFVKKKSEQVEGLEAWEIEFKETRSPTVTMTRSGKDVPMVGSLWVVPADGVVIRTHMQMRDFAAAIDAPEIRTLADFTVRYQRHDEFGMWLPERMTEIYAGPIRPQPGRAPIAVTTNATAKYLKLQAVPDRREDQHPETMTTTDRLDGWKAVGAISEEQHALLTAFVRHERFSVFVELSALLYLGVLSIVGGLVWTFRDYVASLGDAAILSILALLMALSFGYCFTRTGPYSNDEVESPTMVFDYVLYFACLVFSATLAFIETRFGIFHGWDTHLLIAAIVFGVLAYRFDNRFVLSLALSTLAGVIGLKMSAFDAMRDDRLSALAIAYGAFLLGYRLAAASAGHQARISSMSICSLAPTRFCWRPRRAMLDGPNKGIAFSGRC